MRKCSSGDMKNLIEGLNYGLDLLKVIMAFVVVLCHFWNSSSDMGPFYRTFHYMKPLAVPVFAIISFLFFEKVVHYGMTKRIVRLLVPYCVWPLIYVFVLLLFNKCFGIVLYDLSQSMKMQLFWQLLLGSARNLVPQFWYLCVLIVYTIVVYCACKILKGEKIYRFLILIFFVSLILQYKGINKKLFGNLEYEQRYTLGRLIEMMPYISIGMICKRYDIINRIRNNKCMLFLLCGLLYVSLFFIMFPEVNGFGYGGIRQIVISSLIVIIFGALPLEEVNVKIRTIIHMLSEYSFGVYCNHILVGKIIFYYISLLNIHISQFYACVMLWGISIMISVLVSLTLSRLSKLLVR